MLLFVASNKIKSFTRLDGFVAFSESSSRIGNSLLDPGSKVLDSTQHQHASKDIHPFFDDSDRPTGSSPWEESEHNIQV